MRRVSVLVWAAMQQGGEAPRGRGGHIRGPADRRTVSIDDKPSPYRIKHRRYIPHWCIAALSHSPSILLAVAVAALAACGPRYSADTYATRAVQQANKVEQGTVVGRRPVKVSAEGSTGAAAGAAAGGVLGAQAPGGGIISALGGVGGALVGGLVGTAAEHTVVDTRAYEYVVRTGKGDLLSVTQTDTTPLAVGQKVLLIAGNQARIVPDYTSEPAAMAARAETPPAAPPAPAPAPAAAPGAGSSPPSTVAATEIAPADPTTPAPPAPTPSMPEATAEAAATAAASAAR
jgi:outer membrane lipoprotein SlyB